MSMNMSTEELLESGFREELPGVWASPLAQEIGDDFPNRYAEAVEDGFEGSIDDYTADILGVDRDEWASW